MTVRGGMHHYARMCMQHLIKANPTKPGYYLPELATSWELAPDLSSYTFKLRKGVKFHDGTDFNAEAVKWNFDRVLDSPQPFLKEVSSIEVLDEYTIRLNLSDWSCVILSDLEREPLFIMSPTAFKELGHDGVTNHPVGTGPWMLSDWIRGQHTNFVKFPDYWEEGLPYLDGVNVQHIQDPMTATMALKKGDIHVFHQADRVSSKEMQDEGYDIQTFIGQLGVIVMNTTDPSSMWKDKRLREALEYAIDKERICQAFGYGWVQPHYELVYGIHAFTDPGTTPRKYNPAKAKQLLAMAGYPNGFKVKMVVVNLPNNEFALALQQNLAEVGIKLEFEMIDRARSMEYTYGTLQGNTLFMGNFRYDPPNLVGGVRMGISKTSLWFPYATRPDEFETTFQQVLKEVSPEKQLEMLAKMEKSIYEDVSFVPLWNQPMFNISDPSVKDADWYPTGPFQELERCWIEK